MAMTNQYPGQDISAGDGNRATVRIGILVVAYNAVTTLAKVLRRIPEKVWNEVEEVAVFDDASGDDTFELSHGLRITAGLEKLTVTRNAVNLGYGGNQKLGYRYFMDKGFDIVVLLHGDGQYAPEVMRDLYLPLLSKDADAVLGSRMMPDYGGPLRGHMPLYKYLGNRILTLFENGTLGMHLTEYHSGYRAYSLDALRRIRLDTMTDEFHFDTQIIIKLHHQGFRIKEVAIPTYYGGEISYVNGMKYAWDVFRSVMGFRRTLSGGARYPEFAEYFVHYPLKESHFSSHYYFQRLSGTNNDILDIGSGEGFFAERISKAGNRVVGIDVVKEARHRGSMQNYIQADLEQGLALAKSQLHEMKFDKVLLQDVLEHLRKPEVLLRDCLQVLKANGQLLVSVPNVANIAVRLSLLFGRFAYTDRGILDKTHLRFYTRRSAEHLLLSSGYDLQDSWMTIMPIELALGLSARNPLMRASAQILNVLTRVWPALLGYQCIIVAVPSRTERP